MAQAFQRFLCPVCINDDVTEVYRMRPLLDPARCAPVAGADCCATDADDHVVAHCPECDLLFTKQLPAHGMRSIAASGIDAAATTRALTALRGHIRRIGRAPEEISLLDYDDRVGPWTYAALSLGLSVFTASSDASLPDGVERITDADIDIDDLRFDIVHAGHALDQRADVGRAFARLARAARIILIAEASPRPALPARNAPQSLSDFAPAERGMRAALVADLPVQALNVLSEETMRWLADRNGLTLADKPRGLSGMLARFSGAASDPAEMLFRRRVVAETQPSAFSMAPTSTGSSGAIWGEKRPITVPSRSTRNFSKFHRTSGSSVASMP